LRCEGWAGTLGFGREEPALEIRGGKMQFGIFDQNDHGPYALTEQYDRRLALIELYDKSGFRTYHMSEHHSTPLNLTPSPSVFLAAVA
jgi:alkanesulfonate monooxygenase SsuD/methylene tetrahydromethanopterin reductase-like flavin-dependent oxidoreductase (luciferase family)